MERQLTVGQVRAALRDYDDEAPVWVGMDLRVDLGAIKIDAPVVAITNDEGEPTILATKRVG